MGDEGFVLVSMDRQGQVVGLIIMEATVNASVLMALGEPLAASPR